MNTNKESDNVSRFGLRDYSIDALFLLIAVVLSVWFRFEFEISSVQWLNLTALCGATVVTFALSFRLFTHRRVLLHGQALGVAAPTFLSLVVVSLIVGLPVAVFGNAWQIPRSTFMFAIPTALALMALRRYQKKRRVIARIITWLPSRRALPLRIVVAITLTAVVAISLRVIHLTATRRWGSFETLRGAPWPVLGRLVQAAGFGTGAPYARRFDRLGLGIGHELSVGQRWRIGGAHVPGRSEPDRQRRASVLEDRPRGARDPLTAAPHSARSGPGPPW